MEHRHSLQKLRHSRAGGNPTPILLAPTTVAAKVEVRSWIPAYAGMTRHVCEQRR
jgi:hypothetical protein